MWNYGKLISALRDHYQEITQELHRLEEENNKIIVNAFDLQNEISSAVPLEEISLISNPSYRYKSKKTKDELEGFLRADTMKEIISYAVGCMFGRYSLDKPGLILANQGETAADYRRQVPDPSFSPDEDNVIPILDEGWFSDDITARFKRFLRVTFGDEHYEENLDFLENAIGGSKDRRLDIRSYFLKDFYNEHIKMYHKRPIYWLFSSPKGSFNALVYLHRYRPDTVSVVLNDYLASTCASSTATKPTWSKSACVPPPARPIVPRPERDRQPEQDPGRAEGVRGQGLSRTRQLQIDLDDGVKVNYNKFGPALKNVKGLSD